MAGTGTHKVLLPQETQTLPRFRTPGIIRLFTNGKNLIVIHVKVTGVVMDFMYDGVPDFSFRNKHVFSYVSLVRTYSCGMLRKGIEHNNSFFKNNFVCAFGRAYSEDYNKNGHMVLHQHAIIYCLK